MMRFNFIKKTWEYIKKSGYDSEHQWVPLGAIGVISFILYYFIWKQVAPNEYDNIPLRIVGGVLCLFLTLKDFWPQVLKPILPIYWFFTLLYCFPFFFSYMVLKNPDSSIWILTTITGVFFLLLLVNWVMLLVIISTGILAAWCAYILTTDIIVVPVEFFKTLPNYLTVLIAGSIFIFRNDQVQKEKLNSLITLSSIIAHELRTPLRTIDSSIDGIAQVLPKLSEGYALAKQQQLNVPFIAPQQLNSINQLTDNVKSETYAAFNFIDMLLLKTKSTSEGVHQNYSMRHCVSNALARYPFTKEEREHLHVTLSGDDFTFYGNDYFMMHIFFNLLKNALYYIHKAQKGEIFIHLQPGASYNNVYFKDTGTGIAKKDLVHIFERFFSKTYHGTGLGLAFSKMVMESIGGKISCQSVLGEYTEFILSFPVIHE